MTVSLLSQDFDLEKLLIAAESGDPESQLILGADYISGEHVPIDSTKGFYWLQQASLNGNVEALYQRGFCHIKGIGTSKDVEKGVDDIKAAALVGYAPAQGCLGLMFYNGTIVEYYTKQMKYTIFQPTLYYYIIHSDALTIYYSDKFEQNDTEAMYWLNQAAENDDTYAMLILAKIYKNGECGVEPDEQSYIKKIMHSAELGNTLAQRNLAFCYKEGDGIEPDESKYLEWLTKSAYGGNVYSRVQLGDELKDSGSYEEAIIQYMEAYATFYLDNVLFEYLRDRVCDIIGEGNCADSIKANVINFLKRDAENGYVPAQVFLGELYASENIHEYKKAVYWYKKALAAGYKEANIDLSNLYMSEASPLHDTTIGIEYLKASAELGDASAQFQLGRAYCVGDWGLSIDFDKGVELISASALQEHIEAMREGGFVICFHGDKIKDKKKRKQYCTIGVKLLEMGVANGDSGSAWYLGLIYSTGTGVQSSRSQSTHYMEMAARMGNVDAIDFCQKFNILY